jgi:uncharacterized SAM-binding protein YcdF (DUF218 family)
VDFFLFSKILPSLLYPLPLALLVLGALSFAVPRKGVRWGLRLTAVALWTLATPWFADQVSTWWEAPLKNEAQLPAVSDAAVVLGGLSDGGHTVPPRLQFNRAAERITEAVDLWRQGRVKALLITSGSGDPLHPDWTEAPALAAWAEAAGVPKAALVVEAKSRNTRENATFSLPLADAHGFRSLVLVTSAAHMPRSEAIFRKAGYASGGRTLVTWPVDTQLQKQGFPANAVPDPSSLATVQSVIKEAVGYAVYRVMGYL